MERDIEDKRLVWMIWDAASMEIVNKLLNEDKLPNLKKLMEKGRGLRMKLNQLNCQTPAALAALFTGMSSYENGISGFYIPELEEGKSMLQKKSSFHSNDIHSKAIWNYAVSNKKTVALVHVPFVAELSKSETSYYKAAFDGYRKRFSRGIIFTASSMDWQKDVYYTRDRKYDALSTTIKVDGFTFRIYLYYKALKRYITVFYMEDSFNQRLDIEIGETSIDKNYTLVLQEGTVVSISAFYKPDDKEELLIVFSGINQVVNHTGNGVNQLIKHAGAFEGEGYGRYYRKGVFGKTLYEGGTGEAEAVFLQLLNRAAIQFQRSAEYCLQNYPADLTILYQPCIDEASHEFMGFCDTACELYDENSFYKYWSCITEAYQMADRHLGAVMNLLPKDAVIVVNSDHGMAAVSKVFYINSYLKEKGFLEFDQYGNIDLAKTSAFFHPADNGSIFINTENYENGKIAEKDKHIVIDKLIRVLEEFKDAVAGERVIKRILRIDGQNRELFGDIFVEPTFGYCIKGDWKDKLLERTYKSGDHHYNPDFSTMDGICFISENAEGYGDTINNTEVFKLVWGLL